MAPSNEDWDRHRSTYEEQNPFIVFRRYADEQLSSLLQGLIGLPSARTSLSSDERWRPFDERRREWEMRTWGASSPPEDGEQRKACEDQTEDGAVDDASKKYTETNALPKDYRGSEGYSSHPSEDGYPLQRHPFFNPTSSGDPQSYTLGSDLLFQRGICPARAAGILSDAFTLAWPLSYLVFSPYSPLRLEQQEFFRDHGPRWRNAFEDLIALERNKALPDRSPENIGDRGQDAGEWVTTLMTQGFGDGWKRISGGSGYQVQRDTTAMDLDSRQPDNDAVDEAETELDLYERLLASPHTPPTAGTIPSNVSRGNPALPSHPAVAKISETAEGPGIISALTTTERKVLPDGTVHTKVVLKKKFADGREESSETVHTTQGSVQQSTQAPTAPNGKENASEDAGRKDEENKNKGWFWSG
ncbi:MAG: hypothetical protein M1830_010003 [Pleopsidium flavum]|nr:MAG: hypothetical protein M1830_010003 [Pleopsidium flavum]